MGNSRYLIPTDSAAHADALIRQLVPALRAHDPEEGMSPCCSRLHPGLVIVHSAAPLIELQDPLLLKGSEDPDHQWVRSDLEILHSLDQLKDYEIYYESPRAPQDIHQGVRLTRSLQESLDDNLSLA